MNDQIKEIAEKFLSEENVPLKQAMLLATLGLTKSVGDIADLTYGVNFSQHPYSDERKNAMAEYLGYALLNWQILAMSSGFSNHEITSRFAAEWLTKRSNSKASIKDLLKHLKPAVKQESTTQEQQVKSKPAQIDTSYQPQH